MRLKVKDVTENAPAIGVSSDNRSENLSYRILAVSDVSLCLIFRWPFLESDLTPDAFKQGCCFRETEISIFWVEFVGALHQHCCRCCC